MSKFYYKYSPYFSILLVVLLMLVAITKSVTLLVLLLVGVGMLIFNPIYLLPVLVISSLSGNYFDIGNGISISRIVGIFFIVGSILYYGDKIALKKDHFIIIVLIFILNLISSTYSITGSYHGFIMMLPNLAIALVCSGIKTRNIRKISTLLIISAVISIIFIAINVKSQLIIIQVERLTTEESVNANRFAMMLAQLIAIIASGYVITKIKTYKILLLAIILIAYFMLILSGSRSATIGITVSTIIIISYIFLRQKKKALIPIFILVIAGYFFYDFITQMDIPVLNRFTVQNVVESGGTGRFDIWATLVPYNLVHHLWFGVGFGGGNVYELAYRHGLAHAAHNFIIDLFLQVGIVGFLIYMYYFFKVGRRIISKLNNPLMMLPLWMFLTAIINGIGETIFSEKLFWIGIALVWLFANNLQNVRSDKIRV